MEIRVAEHPGAELHCALCRGRLPKLSTRCDDCGTRMHFACRSTLPRCPTLGCASAPHEQVVSVPASLLRPLREARKRRILRRTAAGFVPWIVGALVVVGGVAALWPAVESQLGDVRRIQARTDLDAIGQAIALYAMDTHRQPRSLADLRSEPIGVRGWSGPYLAGGTLVDPWGQRYVYRDYAWQDYELLSYGADGAPGGAGRHADVRY